MLIVKWLHIVFVISWFAGLFYLPRIFVNHAMIEDVATHERLALMEYKLFRFMTPLGLLALATGGWLMSYGFSGGWLHAKLALVFVLIVYHVYCGVLVKRFAAQRNVRSHVWYRVFNEAPVLLLFAVAFLAVVKPF